MRRPMVPDGDHARARRQVVQCLAGLIGLSVVQPSGVWAQSKAPPLLHADQAASEVTRHLRFEITCSNPGGQALAAESLWLYGPVAQTATQRLVGVECSVPLQQSIDELGNAVWCLSLPPLPPFGTRSILLGTEVRMRPAPVLEPLASPQAWRGSERLMDLSDPHIRALAATLKQPEPMASARAIYDWVGSHLIYAGFIPDDLGASVALAQLRGDCTEYAYLVAALARAMGLPARVMGGFVCEQDMAPLAAQYHNWAELYVDGAWRLVDAQKGAFLQPCVQYIAFRICSDRSVNALGQANRFYTASPARLYFR
jgi:hypothetical protein